MILDAGYWELDNSSTLNRRFARRGVLLMVAILSHALGNPPLAAAEFRMSDALTCTIETSTAPAETGKKIALTGLTNATPQVVFENHVRSTMVTLFESDQTVVIQLVATGSGSVATVVIEKLTGRFAHTAAGAFLKIHAVAETGSCRPELRSAQRIDQWLEGSRLTAA